MGLRKVPVAHGKGLVLGVAQANHGPGLALRLRPVQIDGRVVNRVAAENHQRLDLAGVEGLREIR